MTRHLAYPHLVGSVPDCPACQATAADTAERMEIGPRSTVFVRPPVRRRDTTSGTARAWGRTINGHPYSFTVTVMPSGERRISVARRTDGAWMQVHAWAAC